MIAEIAEFDAKEKLQREVCYLLNQSHTPIFESLGPCVQSRLIQGKSISTKTDCHKIKMFSVLFRLLSVIKLKTDLQIVICAPKILNLMLAIAEF